MAELKDIYCEKFSVELDSMIIALTGIKEGLNNPIKQLRRALTKAKNGITSESSQIDSDMAALQDAMNQTIPTNLGDVNELLSLAAQCSLISDELTTVGPESLNFQLNLGTSSTLDDIISSAIETLNNLIEYPVAVILDTINQILDKAKMEDIVDKLNKYIECADALCGGSLSTKNFR